ncbi:unnamed protein product, partial [marine sediment metagenome]
LAEKVAESVLQIKGVRQVTIDGSYHIVECPPEQDPRPKIMEVIVQNGWILLTMESIEMSLEDIFLQLTTEGEADG